MLYYDRTRNIYVNLENFINVKILQDEVIFHFGHTTHSIRIEEEEQVRIVKNWLNTKVIINL